MSYKEKSDSYFGVNGDDELKSSLRNLAVGATPVLLDFLTGKTAQMKTRGFQRANDFTKSLAAEKAIEVDINGEPVLMPEGEAMFRKKWHSPEKEKNQTLADPSNVQSTIQVFNKKAGTSQILTVLKDGSIGYKLPDGSFVDIDPREIEKDYGVGMAKSKNPKGESTTTQFRKNKPSEKTILGQDKGLATHMGVDTEAEARARIEQAEKAKTEASKIESDIASLRQSYGLVLTTNNPNTFATEGFGIIKRAINDGKMSDKDLQNAMGSDYRSYFDEAGNFLEGKIKGGIPPRLRKNFAQLIKDLVRKNEKIKDITMTKGKRPEGLSKSGRETLGGIVGTDKEQETFEQKKNRLKSL